MRRFTKIFSSLLAVLLLAGCAARHPVKKNKYQLVNEDDNYYIILDDEIYESDKSHIWTGTVSFQSVEEMKHDILNGDFNSVELRYISNYNKLEDGKIPVFNLDSLFELQYPDYYEGFHIFWFGYDYQFTLYNPNTKPNMHNNYERCYVGIYEGDKYQGFINYLISTEAGMLDLPKQTLGIVGEISVSTDAERNANVYFYQQIDETDEGEEQLVDVQFSFYSLENGPYHYTVMEKEYKYPSNETRYHMTIVMAGCGQCVYITIEDRQEPFSIEFITSFGITKYEG